MAKVTKVTKVTKLVPTESFLPNGTYSGLWSGYSVTLKHNGETYELETEVGVKGINCRCTVTVENGEVRVNV
jgi:hypothetical protein